MKTGKYLALLGALILAAAIAVPVAAISPQGSEYLRKARVFFSSNDFRMALDYLQRARQLDPDAPEIAEFAPQLQKKVDERVKELRQRAIFFLDSKNLPEAEKLFSEVLTLAADDEYSVLKLKEISSAYKQIEEFKNQGIDIQVATGRSHDVDMYSAISFMNRARGFFAQGDRVNALDMVEKVLKREPGYKPALELKDRILHINRLESFVEKAETAFLEGRMRETIESLNALIIEMPERHEFVLMRAKAFLKLKNYRSAERDLWKYHHARPDPAILFPLLSEAYLGQENYLNAYAFAHAPETGEPIKSFGYRFRCHFFAFPLPYCLLGIFLGLMPLAVYFTWHAAEALFFERFSVSSLGLAVSCVFTIMLKTPEHCLGNLIVVARDLNIAWVNYLTGITLLKVGQIEGAQRFLAFSFSNETIRPRAYYFYGITRKLLKNNLYELDFEESVLSGLSRHRSGWHPNFVKQIERELLISYSKDKSDETFEGMAFKLVEDATGG